MKLLNSIQLVTIIALGPILVPLLRSATFYGAYPLFWVCSIAWFVMYVFAIILVRTAIDGE